MKNPIPPKKPKSEKRGRSTIPRKPELKLKDFERQIKVRPLVFDDYEALVAMEQACFPGMGTWSREHVLSQLTIFPEGQIVVEYKGRIVASSASLIVDFSEHEAWHDWKEVSDNGFITSHDPEGDTLYGIELMVHPDFRGMKLSRRLYDARKAICREHNLRRIVVGGRIPGYALYAEEMTATQYVEYVIYKDIYDPVLTPQLANGFVLRGLISDYLEGDDDSMGYATHLEWLNLDYRAKGKTQHKTVSSVRLCSVQWQMRALNSFEDFETQAEFYVDVASDHRADFVLFPELFTLELLSIVKASETGQAARKLAEFTPRYLDLFTDLAVRYSVNVIGGSQFTVEDDCLYNIAYLFRRDGTIGKQYKIHVTPNERRWWGVSPGNQLQVFDTDCGPIAIHICYDVEFPELARYAAARGVRILFVPFNTDERSGFNRVRVCAQARCVENHMYVVTAGCVGHLPFVDNADIHYAQSAIYTPSDIPFSRDGVGAEASVNIAQVILHDVDVELVRRHRLTGTTNNWKDRRTDLYRCVFTVADEPESI